MKRNIGIYLLLLSFIVSAFGTFLKIIHSTSADIFLAIGLISFAIGFAIVIFKLLTKKSI